MRGRPKPSIYVPEQYAELVKKALGNSPFVTFTKRMEPADVGEFHKLHEAGELTRSDIKAHISSPETHKGESS